MPLFNSVGEAMPQLTLSQKEQNKIAKLSNLKYPKDEARIFHLSPKDFKAWIYLQPPQELFAFDYRDELALRIEHQVKKWRWSLIRDFVWRIFN